jgi:DNA mismatch endonuclease, patch repair protein
MGTLSIPPSSAAVSARMRRTPRRDTPAELELRSLLHGRGWRFFVDRAPLASNRRKRADIVFPRYRVAVFLDGCFWHGCPIHGTAPKANAAWWRAKLDANQRRDTATNAELETAGWAVVRVWEHEDPIAAADRVERALRRRRGFRAALQKADK